MNENIGPEQPIIPDTIEEVISSLHYREENRRRAVDLAIDAYYNAKTDEERDSAEKLALDMTEIRQDFRARFPEVFPRSSENQ